MRSKWVKQPSKELCADQCGAKCCKADKPGWPFILMLTEEEKVLFATPEYHSQHRVRINGRPVFVQGIFAHFKQGQCEHLENNLCKIYDDYNKLPAACRKFPQGPVEGCLVWPNGE